MQPLNLHGFDFEYAQLVKVEWIQDFAEMKLSIQVPVEGWYFKEKILKLSQRIGLSKLFDKPCIEYILDLRFLGVSKLNESLFTQGHTTDLSSRTNAEWIEAATTRICLEITEIHNVELDDKNARLYLHVEDLNLEFNYKDYIFLQKCASNENL